MDQTETHARNLGTEITQLFVHLLSRNPRPAELDNWINRATQQKLSFADLFNQVLALEEYKASAGVITSHPPGHFYSPVVNSAELVEAGFKVDRYRPLDTILGVDMAEETLQATFNHLAPHIGMHRFPTEKRDGERYYLNNALFPHGDAAILAAMLAHFRPKRVIEIGSGFSTACMLDSIERNGLDTRITCVEPYPVRLRANLTEKDSAIVDIVEAKVQKTDPETYRDLEANDILFIDSTHVMKTGSDVCFELFEILPRLKPGVIVHIHDIQYPFEYPDVWIFEKKRSWNEIYAVRAFLMYNTRFEVIYFNNYFGRKHADQLAAAYGEPIKNPGGGIWMRVRG